MARTPDPTADRHHQHSMVLVPLDTPGVEIERMLPGVRRLRRADGHGEVTSTTCACRATNVIAGPGRASRSRRAGSGPGRIHHCMRCIGAAERALELPVERGMTRTAFGKPLARPRRQPRAHRRARIAIDQARLLHAARGLEDRQPGRAAAHERDLRDQGRRAEHGCRRSSTMAMQIHGGGGLSDDMPLAGCLARRARCGSPTGRTRCTAASIARIELASAGHAEGDRMSAHDRRAAGAVRDEDASTCAAVDAWLQGAGCRRWQGTPRGHASSRAARRTGPTSCATPTATSSCAGRRRAPRRSARTTWRREYRCRRRSKPRVPVRARDGRALRGRDRASAPTFYVMERVARASSSRKELPRGPHAQTAAGRAQLCVNAPGRAGRAARGGRGGRGAVGPRQAARATSRRQVEGW